jgi:hypothetical protein
MYNTVVCTINSPHDYTVSPYIISHIVILQDIFCIERALSLVLSIEIQEIYQLFDLFVGFIDQKTLF